MKEALTAFFTYIDCTGSQVKFHLNTRRKFFTLRVTEHWHRLPRGAVGSPSLEILKTHLGWGPVQPALGDPASAAGLDWMICRGPFQPLPFCDSIIQYGRATWVYMEERGEGEVKPAKLASDHVLSQLELDYVTCEYFMVTSWKTYSQAIKANQWKIRVLASQPAKISPELFNILRGKNKKSDIFGATGNRKEMQVQFC